MNQEEVKEIFVQAGALVLNSHLVYTSGRHGSAYINKDALYSHPKTISHLCKTMANSFSNSNIEVVLGPALGGIILSQWVSFHLSDLYQKEVLSVYAEKCDRNGFVIKRGYDQILKNRRTLIVEDVVTTGGSVKKVLNAASALKANIVGLSILCNRGGLTKEALCQSLEQSKNIDLFELLKFPLESWSEKDCPLCINKIPVNIQIGKGLEFVQKQQDSL